MPKRHALYQTFRFLVDRGISPEQVVEAIAYRKPESIITCFAGHVREEDVLQSLNDRMERGKRGRYHPARWFTSEDELIRFGGNTYIVSNQWGRYTERALQNMATRFPQHPIRVESVKQNQE